MSTKVKGLLKGLRYISQMFDEKEQDMQIGFPTDVKHVAHIGWDGPSANNKPSWMNEFEAPPEAPNGLATSIEEVKNLSIQPPPRDTSQIEKPKKSRRPSSGAGLPLDSPGRKSNEGSSRHSRRHASTGNGSPTGSPRDPDAPRHSRRHRSSKETMDSPSGDKDRDPSGSSRSSRRQRNTSTELSTGDQPSIPKHSRGRRSKGGSGNGPSRSSRSKEQSSSTDGFSAAGNGLEGNGPEGSDSGHARKNTAGHLSSVLEAYEEQGK